MTENDVRRIAQEVYQNLGSRFGVNQTPVHVHNNLDAPNVPAENVTGFVPLPATSGGVANPGTIGNQIITQGDTTRGYGVFTTVSKATFPNYPLIIVNGNGVGVDSQFNGGYAPEGTLLFFNNGPTISGLWIRSGGQWYGIGQNSTGYSNRTIS